VIPALAARLTAHLARRPAEPSPVGLEGGIPLHKWDQQVELGLDTDRRANATAVPRGEDRVLERLADLTRQHNDPWKAAHKMKWNR
jgi:hypothetical protein